MSDSVIIIGLQELGSKIDMFSQQVERAAIRKAANAGANVFRNEMRRLAPVRQDQRPMGSKQRTPGYLKKHIGRQGKATWDGYTVAVGPMKSAFYGRFLELGTSHQGANPFIRPTFDGQKTAAIDAFASSLKSDVEALLR